MKHRRRLAAGLVAGTAIVATMASAPAQANGGYTQMNIWNSSHCLDNDSGNASVIQMWRCSGASEQQWLEENETNSRTSERVSTFVNQRFGWCVYASTTAPGAVFGAVCDPSDEHEQWRVFASGTSYNVWQNVANGLCLTTPSVGNGTLVRATECDPSDQYDRWQQQ